MGIIPKRNGFSSTNVKLIDNNNNSNNKNNSKNIEINDIFNSSKKNLSKEIHKHNNSKDSEIKAKNTFKNKLTSISILNGNGSTNFWENSSRNHLINELMKRKQYLNKQMKYFPTNDSSKISNCSYLHSEKKKINNSNSNSINNFKETENLFPNYNTNNKEKKQIKRIKIKI